MATGLRGVDVLVKVGSGTATYILGQRNAQLNMDVSMIDMRVKNSFPNADNLPGWQTWSIECDGAVIIQGNNDVMDICALMQNGTKCKVEVTMGEGGNKYSGDAYISNIKISSTQESEATFSMTLTGTGALTMVNQ